MPAQTVRLPLLPETEAAMNRYLNAVRFSDGSTEDRDYAFKLKRDYDALKAVDPACVEEGRPSAEKVSLYLSGVAA